MLFSNHQTTLSTRTRKQKVDLYTGFDRKVTREQETEWLAQTLVAIEGEDVINVVADIGGNNSKMAM